MNQNPTTSADNGEDNYQLLAEVRWLKQKDGKLVLQQACLINPLGQGQPQDGWVDVPVVQEE